MTLSFAGINRAMREVSLADQSQFFLKLANIPNDACLVETIDVDDWTLHRDYRIQLKVLLRQPLPRNDLLGLHATFSVLCRGVLKPLHGVVSRVENADGNGHHTGLNLTIRSVLWPLTTQQHNRVFVDKSVLSIARELLKDSLSDRCTLETLAEDTAVRPMTVQYEESDYAGETMTVKLDNSGFTVDADPGLDQRRHHCHQGRHDRQ